MTEKATEEAKRRGGSVPGKPKPRSPSYPGINLERAIDRARIIYEHERKHEVAVDIVCAHWGFKPKTGPATVTLAALKAFGLLDAKHGEDTVKLSDLMLRIILDTREDKTERRKTIQEAALKPPMHRDVWDKYRADLPSDSTLRYYLMKEKGFTEIGAQQFITQYRATVAFAHLGKDAVVSSEPEEEIPEQKPAMTSPPSASHGSTSASPMVGMREILIPIPGGAWPSLKATFPLSEQAWDEMLKILQAMKPGLTNASTGEERK
ncbi:MAG: hypothetical protein ACREXW_05745 [Gammaproteobacteria bacterium]